MSEVVSTVKEVKNNNWLRKLRLIGKINNNIGRKLVKNQVSSRTIIVSMYRDQSPLF